LTYRDSRDAELARIAALESELASAKERIAELEGKRSRALVLAGGGDALTIAKPAATALRLLGAPLRLELTREWEQPFPVEHFEDLIERLRTMTGNPGRSEILPSSLTWSASSSQRGTGPFMVVTVSVKNGRTVLCVTDRLHQLAGAWYGGVGGGVGGGLVVLPIFASAAVPVLAPLFVGAWLGSIYAGVRMIFKFAARRRAQSLQQVFEAMVEEIGARCRELTERTTVSG
jgi:hypothetical protein